MNIISDQYMTIPIHPYDYIGISIVWKLLRLSIMISKIICTYIGYVENHYRWDIIFI